MPISRLNGVRLYWDQHGESGPPLVLVHGSWGDHHNWDAVVPALARSFRVFTYDRRGHSQSERPAAQGSIEEDVADLAALIRAHQLEPAHVVGNSFGAAVALRLAAAQPQLFATLAIHEPPLVRALEHEPVFPAVRDRIAAVADTLRSGEMERGARQFVETIAFGPGGWAKLTPEMQRTFVFNAPTFLDEADDRDCLAFVSGPQLARFDRPALVTEGGQSAPFFRLILERVAAALPRAQRHTFAGAGHVPHLSCPEEYVEVVGGFVRSAGSATSAAS